MEYATDSNHVAFNKQQVQRELRDAVINSRKILFSATTVFPFTLFPDTITVDQEKVTVTKRFFIKIAEIITIRMEDILNVTADIGPFFGSLTITTKYFNPEKPYIVKFLWRHDALKVKRIVQGYLIALQKKIDCSALSVEELRELLDNLGQAAPGEEV